MVISWQADYQLHRVKKTMPPGRLNPACLFLTRLHVAMPSSFNLVLLPHRLHFSPNNEIVQYLRWTNLFSVIEQSLATFHNVRGPALGHHRCRTTEGDIPLPAANHRSKSLSSKHDNSYFLCQPVNKSTAFHQDRTDQTQARCLVWEEMHHTCSTLDFQCWLDWKNSIFIHGYYWLWAFLFTVNERPGKTRYFPYPSQRMPGYSEWHHTTVNRVSIPAG